VYDIQSIFDEISFTSFWLF